MSFGFVSTLGLSFIFSVCLNSCLHAFYISWSSDTVTERTFVHPVRFGMLYWGSLNSTGDDSSHENISESDQMFRGTRITDVSIREGLATFLRDTDRKVIVVRSHKREFMFSLMP